MEFVIIEDYYGNQRNLPLGGPPGTPAPSSASPFIPLDVTRPDAGKAAEAKDEKSPFNTTNWFKQRLAKGSSIAPKNVALAPPGLPAAPSSLLRSTSSLSLPPVPPAAGPSAAVAQFQDEQTPLRAVVEGWVQQTPVTVTITGPSGVGKAFLMNTLLQTGLKDPTSYSHPFDESKKRWEGTRVDEVFGPDAEFFESFNLEKEQAAIARIAEYALHQNPLPSIDDQYSFVLPQGLGASPVYSFRYGPVPELLVSFPSESELRLALWELHEVESGSKRVEPEHYIALKNFYQAVLSSTRHIVPLTSQQHLSQQQTTPTFDEAAARAGPYASPQDLPIPAAVRRVLGKTISWRGHGQDLNIDRVYVREKLRLLTSHTLFAFFAKDVIVRMPCALLEGDTIELNLCNSDAADHVSRSKALWSVKRSNLLLVAVDSRGLTKDLRAQLTGSGYLERLIARADEYKAIVLNMNDKGASQPAQQPPAAIRSLLLDQLRAAMHGRLPAALHVAADRVVANTSVLSVRPLLYASVHLNPRLPLQLNGMTLSQVKSSSNMPSLLGSLNNIKLVKCGAALRDLNTDWMKNVAPPTIAAVPPLSPTSSAPTTATAQPTPASAAAAGAKLAQLQEKISGWKSELAIQAKSLDDVLRSKAQESYIKAAGEWEPFRSRFMQTPEACRAILDPRFDGQSLGADMRQLTCGNLLNEAPQQWNRVMARDAVNQKMDELLNISSNLLQEASQALGSDSTPADERVRLAKLLAVTKSMNERSIRSRMNALAEQLSEADPQQVVEAACVDALHSTVLADPPSASGVRAYQSLVQKKLPDVPREAAKRIQERFGALVSTYNQHLEGVQQELNNNMRAISQAIAPSPAPAQQPLVSVVVDDSGVKPLLDRFEGMAIDPLLSPRSSRAAGSTITPTPTPAPAQQPQPQQQAIYLSDEVWRQICVALDSLASPPRPPATFRGRLEPVHLTRDGNSQFRALSHQIYGSEEAYTIVRLLTMNEILQRPAMYAAAIEESKRVSLEEYVSKMCRDAEWGDNITLYAAANFFQRPIHLFTALAPNALPVVVPPLSPVPEHLVDKPICLALVQTNLYQSLCIRELLPVLLVDGDTDSTPSSNMSRASSGLLGITRPSSNSISLLPLSQQPSASADSSAGSSAVNSDEEDGPASRAKRRSRSSTVSDPPQQLEIAGPMAIVSTSRKYGRRYVRSLVDLCIARISNCLEMLPTLEGCLPEELLQRLITSLIEDSRLSNQVLYKLVDSSIFSLNLENSKLLNDTSCAIIARACVQLRRLSLEGCAALTCEALAHIAAGAPLLEVVNVDGCTAVGDKGISEITRRCANLLVANFSGTRVTDSGLQNLAMCRNLNSIALRRCAQITDKAFQCLPTELLQLDLSECPQLGDEAVLNIANRCRATLQSLKLSGKSLRDPSVIHLARTCLQLRLLELVGCEQITDLAVLAIARHLVLLTTLNLTQCKKLTMDMRGESVRMENLQNLDLSRCLHVTDSAMQRWLSPNVLPLLASLNLSTCEEVGDGAMLQLATNARHLRMLNISKCTRVHDAALCEVLRACPNLARVVLQNCNITDTTVQQLALSAPQLVELDVGSCLQLTDNSIRQLAKSCSLLESINLEEIPNLTDVAVAALAEHCAELRTVNLAYCRSLTDSALSALATHCRLIRQLDLSHCNGVTLGGLKAALDSWQYLRVLALRGYVNLITEGIEHPGLQVLNLGWCKALEDASLVQIAEGCPRLTSLDLAWCVKISDMSIQRFAQKLNSTPSLRSLNLRGCNKVTSLWLKMLATNKRLQIFR